MMRGKFSIFRNVDHSMKTPSTPERRSNGTEKPGQKFVYVVRLSWWKVLKNAVIQTNTFGLMECACIYLRDLLIYRKTPPSTVTVLFRYRQSELL